MTGAGRNSYASSGLDERLGRQALRRDLTNAEQELGRALEKIFAAGQHDFAVVAAELNRQSVARPSGKSEGWTAEGLGEELARVNASLDEAYNAAPTLNSYA